MVHRNLITTREGELEVLLGPLDNILQWTWEDGRHYVSRRIGNVRIAYPFLTDEERARADDWLDAADVLYRKLYSGASSVGS